MRWSCLLVAIRQPDAHELPAYMGREEVTVGTSNVRLRGCARTATQDHLVAHEFAVVLADCSGRRPESGIRRVSTSCPLPQIAEHLPKGLGGIDGSRVKRF